MIIITRVSIRQPTGAERVIIIRNTTCWPCGVYLSSALEEVWTLLFGGLGLLFSYRKWWLVVTGGKKVQHFLSFRGNYAFCQSASPLPRNDCSKRDPNPRRNAELIGRREIVVWINLAEHTQTPDLKWTLLTRSVGTLVLAVWFFFHYNSTG